MNEEKKQQKISIMKILGRHIEKFRNIFIVVTVLNILIQVIGIAWWWIDDNVAKFTDYIYLSAYLASLLVSIITIVCLILNKKGKLSTFRLSIFLYIYSFLVFVITTTICILDLADGLSPIVYLTICMYVSGLLVVEPIYFSILILLSASIIFTFDKINNYDYFNEYGSMLNLIIFLVVSIVLGYRHYNVTIRESRSIARMEQLTYYDDLTGLYNERSYFIEVEKIIASINRNDARFAVVVMDVNNVKVTNDAYGHRFGCHLIVKCAHTLPTIFKTSKLYHVGGDEFIAIIYGEDLDNIDAVIKNFDEQLRYSNITYENHDLIFSIARGYAKFEPGMEYKEVFQKADKAMYDNKIEIKSTYKMKSRDQ